MKSTVPSFVLLFLLMPAAAASITLIDPPTKGRQYETLYFRFAQDLQFGNPFDLRTNRVELVIRQPDFSRRVLSFFYNGLDKNNAEQWEARFAPKQAGSYLFSVSIGGKVDTSVDLTVEASDGKKQGGLMLSGRPGFFRYESGETFRGIGLNVCWAGDYEYYFRKMRDAGITVTRIWLCPWNLSFEWAETGLGRYSLDAAGRLDSILQMADRYGIYVMLCIDYHGIARKGMGYFRENRWPANPYNKINGGPCADATELFTSEEAKEFFRRKYTYIVSRFGHSPRVLAWEFFNEADLMAGQSIPMNRWHIEMAEYIQSIDVHDRFVSTSSTRQYPEKVVDAFKSPAMDFVMFHDYNSLNIAPHFTDLHEAAIEYYQKPVVIAEFGVEFRGGDRTYTIDSQHVGLHNGIWSGWFNETPVVPLSWWWDSYIDRHALWNQYLNLSRFAETMDFGPEHCAFKTLPAGSLVENPQVQAACMVRCIYSGDKCALWFKSEHYTWSLVSEGAIPQPLGAFVQVIPDLVPGRYAVTWYDPQTGKFLESTAGAEVRDDGLLSLPVPRFAKDIACMAKRRP